MEGTEKTQIKDVVRETATDFLLWTVEYEPSQICQQAIDHGATINDLYDFFEKR